MEGLVALVNEIATGMGWLLPTACYGAAISCLIFSIWGIYQYYHPTLQAMQDRPWLPYLSLVLCGVFASFNVILTKSTASAGTDVQVSLADTATSYSTAGSLLSGTGPKDAILTIVTDFALFFQMFGAWTCFFAVLTWFAIQRGRSNRDRLGCGVQYVFGVMLLNPVKDATWILSFWP
ncbi:MULTISPECIES: hypothetical protein [Gluconobacter]|uniref:Uncharacterized protein n=2 Tax=Gluconobacter TaxID=441 RepID=A0A149S3Z7_GLUOY|nr:MULTISPECIES: hypothetical protein [Gluconobacter]KXV21467.1 hypothetical protein AD934_02310 [Gluconobacter oxydans]KXV49948.1 hypothetical protein AD945_03130 [Gluconobacter albidus]WKE49669.1 hypothetical protein NUJ38_14005 [Gluconobacter oxydans]